jgi:hypothetical protein
MELTDVKELILVTTYNRLDLRMRAIYRDFDAARPNTLGLPIDGKTGLNQVVQIRQFSVYNGIDVHLAHMLCPLSDNKTDSR